MTYPGGAQRQIDYDALQRPETIAVRGIASNALMDIAYQYDNVGNIEQKAIDSVTYDYGYDTLDRLTASTSPLAAEGWEYDANGNRTRDDLNPGNWNYSDNDELKQSPTATYDYDDAGNPTTKTENGVGVPQGQTTIFRFSGVIGTPRGQTTIFTYAIIVVCP